MSKNCVNLNLPLSYVAKGMTDMLNKILNPYSIYAETYYKEYLRKERGETYDDGRIRLTIKDDKKNPNTDNGSVILLPEKGDYYFPCDYPARIYLKDITNNRTVQEFVAILKTARDINAGLKPSHFKFE